jgi:hypothetical protein
VNAGSDMIGVSACINPSNSDITEKYTAKKCRKLFTMIMIEL